MAYNSRDTPFFPLPIDKMSTQERPWRRRSKTFMWGFNWLRSIYWSHTGAKHSARCGDADMNHSWVLLWRLLISSKRPKCVYQSLQWEVESQCALREWRWIIMRVQREDDLENTQVQPDLPVCSLASCHQACACVVMGQLLFWSLIC